MTCRRIILIVTFLSIFVLFCKSDISLAQNIDRYKVIKKIEIRGHKRISTAAINSTITTKVGDVYSSEAISKDVDAIWSLGFFDSIDVEIEQLGIGIKIIFNVYERLVVRNIKFVGNVEIPERKLKASIDLLENDDLRLYLLKLDEDKIRQLYLERGFLFVKIRVEERKSSGAVSIIYHINEGPQIRVKSVDFKGNLSIAKRKLRKLMKTQPKRFPSVFFRGVYDKGTLEVDVERMKAFYRQKGWLDAEIDTAISYSKDRKDMFIAVNVHENERYFVNKISVKGQTIFSEKELLQSLQLVEGGPFLLALLEKDIFEMRLLYGEQGYTKVKIDEKHFFNPNNTDVDIVYNLKENGRIFIEQIKIIGNDKTKDNVIRRQLTFLPGQHLDVSRIRGSQQKLINTGYFDMQSGGPVNISFEPGKKPNGQNVIVDVKEGRSGTLRFGGGFGANVGIFGDISYTDKNFDIFDLPKDLNDLVSGNAFRGAGHVFNIRLAPGLKKQEASISVFNPSVYDSKYSAGVSFFSFGRKREDFDEKRKGASISVGTRINDYMTVGVTPSYEVISVEDVDIDERFDPGNNIVPDDVFDVEGDNSKLGIVFKTNLSTRNNPFLPSKGYLAEASFEMSTLDVEIWKFTISGQKYHTVYNSRKKGKHTLTIGGTLGMVETFSGEEVPIFERFFAGGTGSIRGFRFRGASPNEDTEQVGGNLLMLGSVEYNFPVIKDMLRAVTFIDAGKADRDIGDFSLGNVRASFGFGARISLPIFGRAVISLDWAFPLLQENRDELQRFSFNVGQGGG